MRHMKLKIYFCFEKEDDVTDCLTNYKLSNK